MSDTPGAYSTHRPFLKFYVQQTTGDIIEFGTGHGSTGFIMDLIKGSPRKLISVESDPKWFEDMKKAYPENEQHQYILVKDWKDFLSQAPKENYSIVFIDQSPWEARKWTLDHFKDTAEYVIIHDVDYFPTNGIFGKCITKFKFDFSDCFKNYKTYYPLEPWFYFTGIPTLVGTNTGKEIFQNVEGMHPDF